MTPAIRPRPRLPLVGLATLALLVGACSTAAPSGSPAGGSSVPTATPAVQPTATPAPTAATPTPTPTLVPATPRPSTLACVVKAQSIPLVSDRFVDIKVSTDAAADRLTFVFGKVSLPGPAGPPGGSLEISKPPYTFAGSGAPIVMTGDHVVQVQFRGMSLSNDVGQPTYVGPPDIRPDLPALRHAVLFDASEGIIGWYVGYDGPGCVTLARTATDVTLTLDHP